MTAPTILSAIDGVPMGTPMTDPHTLMPDEDDKARATRMALAYRAYRGMLDRPFKRKARQPDLNISTNRCLAIVRTVTQFLFGQDVQFVVETAPAQPTPLQPTEMPLPEPGEPPTTSEAATSEEPANPAQDALDTVWEANKRALFLTKLATNGSIFGHVFIKMQPNGIVYQGTAYPRLVLLDPQSVTVETDPDDCDLAVAYNITWRGVDASGKSLLRRERTERADTGPGGDVDQGGTQPIGVPEQWVIHQQIAKGTTWVDDPDSPPQDWPHPWCPIFQCQHLPEPNQFWGGPNLTRDLIGLQQALNFAISNRNTILYHHAHPKTWGKGFTAAQLANGIDDVLIIEADNGMLANLEMVSDLHGLEAHIEDIRTDMDEVSGVPSVAVGRMKDLPRGDIPGITLRLLYAPLIAMISQLRETYGDMLNLLNSRLLEVMGQGEYLDCDITWQDMLPANAKEWAGVAPILSGMGVSDKTLIAQLGYDYEAEKAQKQLEDSEKASVGALALQQFDAGLGAGVDGAMSPGSPVSASGATLPGQSPAQQSAALNHPAMQAARSAAIQAAQ